MATKYERLLEKLERSAGTSLFKAHVDIEPEETERERVKFMDETKGRGTFVVIRREAWDL